MSKLNEFKKLHDGPDPLLIGNVWNVQSAAVFQKLDFKAIGTSSAAVAESLGYDDGQQMSFEEYFFIINRIQKCTRVPLSVDLEAGYGTTAEQIGDNIKRLADIGVVGVNIEDSTISGGRRVIVDEIKFGRLLTGIVDKLKRDNVEIFLNLRSDVFLLGLDPLVSNAVRRIDIYRSTGVDGFFFPGITQADHIEDVVKASPLPVNVMAMPGLPSFDRLKNLGVRRISMGNFLNKKTYQRLEAELKNILTKGNFAGLFQ